MHVEGSASILALIELNHLTKTFKGKTQTVDALKDINLHIEQGDIFGIIGMSGAGKSTLVRCINFLEQPTSGSVVIDATMPGRCAAPPAPAMMTPMPRLRAVLAYSHSRSGVRWALTTRFSNSTPNASSVATASAITS